MNLSLLTHLAIVLLCTQRLAATTTTPPAPPFLAQEKIQSYQPVEPKSVPWLVSIGSITNQINKKMMTTFEKEQTHLCVGVILNMTTVLTVGHCVRHAVQTPEQIGIGLVSSTRPSNSLETIYDAHRIPVNKIILHPESNQKPTYDVALLTIKDPTHSFNVTPVSLYINANMPPIEIPTFAISWAAYVRQSRGLKANHWILERVPSSLYSDLGVAQIKERHSCDDSELLCTTSRSMPLCLGDEGAPLIKYNGEKPVVLAIAFSAFPNKRGGPCIGYSSFIPIASVVGWIYGILGRSLFVDI
ncbi:trypsin-like cysteine/serine peptidase domain-containing protein [Absidia repens]|uniref:Trypsin-like cysteine/serine peptidase domain-containing protein n=1 Tax=Absidia repens TaxID=90262 RepID=A0A1X2I897_9FUNG|nr:trypsin-like cysteine/serine peptidase domain-containing protein [Absidia repens]